MQNLNFVIKYIYNLVLYEAPIIEFFNIVKAQLQNQFISKDYIHLLYNFIKVA